MEEIIFKNILLKKAAEHYPDIDEEHPTSFVDSIDALKKALEYWQKKSLIEFNLLQVNRESWPSISKDVLAKIFNTSKESVSCYLN